MTYVLHFAPDNASLIVRLALEHRGIAYRAQLIDRSRNEQSTAKYRALNPLGLIPALQTPTSTLFETGAILLWLADTHGGLGPAPDDPARGDFLKWLFFAANTVHPAERMLFYPDKYIAPDHIAALHCGLRKQLQSCFGRLEDLAATRPAWLGAAAPTILDFYIAALLRWPALYPMASDRSWHDVTDYPNLRRLCVQVETLPCTHALQMAEGLGKTPFSAPAYPNPPIGSAT